MRRVGSAIELFVDGAFENSYGGFSGGVPSGGSLVLGQDQDSVGGGFDAPLGLTDSLHDVAVQVINDAGTCQSDDDITQHEEYGKAKNLLAPVNIP